MIKIILSLMLSFITFGVAMADESAPKKILIVLTSHTNLGEAEDKTGFWYEEMSTPYYEFKDNGFSVDIASVQGGKAEADPASVDKEIQSVARFLSDEGALAKLSSSLVLKDINPEEYDAIFLSGGHGTMWDFYPNSDLDKILESFIEENKIISAVCHGPAGLLNAKNSDGTYFVANKKLTAFTNKEEVLAKKATIVPYMLETELKDRKAIFKGTMIPFKKHVVQDGNLITGQNPKSSEGVAEAVVKALKAKNEAF